MVDTLLHDYGAQCYGTKVSSSICSYSEWGPRRIEFELAKMTTEQMPSRSAIYRAIKRANLIDPHARRRRDEKFKRWERAAPMELWQFDVVGGI